MSRRGRWSESAPSYRGRAETTRNRRHRPARREERSQSTGQAFENSNYSYQHNPYSGRKLAPGQTYRGGYRPYQEEIDYYHYYDHPAPYHKEHNQASSSEEHSRSLENTATSQATENFGAHLSSSGDSAEAVHTDRANIKRRKTDSYNTNKIALHTTGEPPKKIENPVHPSFSKRLSQDVPNNKALQQETNPDVETIEKDWKKDEEEKDANEKGKVTPTGNEEKKGGKGDESQKGAAGTENNSNSSSGELVNKPDEEIIEYISFKNHVVQTGRKQETTHSTRTYVDSQSKQQEDLVDLGKLGSNSVDTASSGASSIKHPTSTIPTEKSQTDAISFKKDGLNKAFPATGKFNIKIPIAPSGFTKPSATLSSNETTHNMVAQESVHFHSIEKTINKTQQRDMEGKKPMCTVTQSTARLHQLNTDTRPATSNMSDPIANESDVFRKEVEIRTTSNFELEKKGNQKNRTIGKVLDCDLTNLPVDIKGKENKTEQQRKTVSTPDTETETIVESKSHKNRDSKRNVSDNEVECKASSLEGSKLQNKGQILHSPLEKDGTETHKKSLVKTYKNIDNDEKLVQNSTSDNMKTYKIELPNSVLKLLTVCQTKELFVERNHSILNQVSFSHKNYIPKSCRTLNIFKFDHSMVSAFSPNPDLYTNGSYLDLSSRSRVTKLNWMIDVLPRIDIDFFSRGGTIQPEPSLPDLKNLPINQIFTDPKWIHDSEYLHYKWSRTMLMVAKNQVDSGMSSNMLVVGRPLLKKQYLASDLTILSSFGFKFHYIVCRQPQTDINETLRLLFDEIFNAKYEWCASIKNINFFDWLVPKEFVGKTNLKFQSPSISFNLIATPKLKEFFKKPLYELEYVFKYFSCIKSPTDKIVASKCGASFRLTYESRCALIKYLESKKMLPDAKESDEFIYNFSDVFVSHSILPLKLLKELESASKCHGSIWRYGKFDDVYAVQFLISTENSIWEFNAPTMIIAKSKKLNYGTVKSLVNNMDWVVSDSNADLLFTFFLHNKLKISYSKP